MCGTKRRSAGPKRPRGGSSVAGSAREQKTCKATQDLDTACPSEITGALSGPCPCGDKGHRKVNLRSEFVCEAGKRFKPRFINGELEAGTAPTRQIQLDRRHPGDGGVHGWLAGHLRVTARKPFTSTRAQVLAVSTLWWRKRSAISLTKARARCKRSPWYARERESCKTDHLDSNE